MIHVQNIDKVYNSASEKFVALDNVNLQIVEHEFVAIMGPSGSGKTSLLSIMGLIDKPTKGRIIINGNDATQLNEKESSFVRKNNIGIIFQDFNLITELSVYENVELPLLYADIPQKERVLRVEHALQQTGIFHKRKMTPNQLSGGQQQRVALARAIVNDPRILLADEPTGNLDSAAAGDILNLLSKLNADGKTIVMVTHSERAAMHANRVIHLFDGHIVTKAYMTTK